MRKRPPRAWQGARALGHLPKKRTGVFGSRSIQHDRTGQRALGRRAVFCWGHSMGSFVARRYTVKYGWALDGVILHGHQRQKPTGQAGIALTNMLGVCKGKKARSRLID